MDVLSIDKEVLDCMYLKSLQTISVSINRDRILFFTSIVPLIGSLKSYHSEGLGTVGEFLDIWIVMHSALTLLATKKVFKWILTSLST